MSIRKARRVPGLTTETLLTPIFASEVIDMQASVRVYFMVRRGVRFTPLQRRDSKVALDNLDNLPGP